MQQTKYFHINGQTKQNLSLSNLPKYDREFLPTTSAEKQRQGAVLHM
jgi:hypothetical protein